MKKRFVVDVDDKADYAIRQLLALSLFDAVTVHEVQEGEGSEGDRIGQILAVIEARLPLTLIDSEDGRYVWPERWKLLRQSLSVTKESGE